MHRQYVVGFVAGALLGLSIGVPGAYALIRGAPVPKSVRPDDGRLSWLLGESRKALRSQEPQRALLMLLDAQRIDPNNAKVDNNLCVALIGVHRYDEAIEACNAALQVQDDLKLARNNLAWAKAEQAKVPGARR